MTPTLPPLDFEPWRPAKNTLHLWCQIVGKAKLGLTAPPAPTGAPSFRQEVAVADDCTHLDQVEDVRPSSEGCEDCIPVGGRWVHLRMCMTCGHVGCCDSSPNRHATAHFHSSSHPLIQSYEPGEDWWWCYADEVGLAVGGPSYSHP